MSVAFPPRTSTSRTDDKFKCPGASNNEMLLQQTYPMSPPSEAPSNTTTRFRGNTTTTTTSSSIASPETDIDPTQIMTTRTPCALRRDQEPPRNANGEIICDHPDCHGKSTTFRRPCEWNKHMDRHERPYRCREPGCELTLGFTYSGGLLRHQREVHKMHMSTKQPLFCPFPNCNRSSGTGFTRRENLEEHKRRRHVDQIPAPRRPRTPPTLTISEQTPHAPEWQGNANKRRRIATPEPAPISAEQHPLQNDAVIERQAPIMTESPEMQIQFLRGEIVRRDEIIERQAYELQRLRNMLQSIPQSSIYGITNTVQGV